MRLGLRASPGVAALATSYVAVVVAWIVVPDRPIYPVAPWETDLSMLAFAVVCGPLFGLAGYGFQQGFAVLERRAPKGNAILWRMPLCYLAIGLIAVPLPLVLGNGHALAIHVFAMEVPLETAVLLLLAKPAATFLTVGSGATGGKLTPSLSTGAVFGMLLAFAWSLAWRVATISAAVAGAAAVLAASMAAPLAAFVLMVEFTGTTPANWPAIAIAVAGAFATCRWIAGRGAATAAAS